MGLGGGTGFGIDFNFKEKFELKRVVRVDDVMDLDLPVDYIYKYRILALEDVKYDWRIPNNIVYQEKTPEEFREIIMRHEPSLFEFGNTGRIYVSPTPEVAE